jgi:RNA polymerase sigma-70 factor (ECF subfamily)
MVLFNKQANIVDKNKQKISDFMQLYKPVQNRLSAYCRVVAGNEEKAFDLVQETLANAFQNFHTLREPDSFQFFLIGIARNCHLKQQRKWKLFGTQSEIKASNILVSQDFVDTQYDNELLYKSIAKLNTEQRDVVLMFHIMGFSIKEIARNNSITEAAVKNRLVRGREKLRKILSDKESQKNKSISANHINTQTK